MYIIEIITFIISIYFIKKINNKKVKKNKPLVTKSSTKKSLINKEILKYDVSGTDTSCNYKNNFSNDNNINYNYNIKEDINIYNPQLELINRLNNNSNNNDFIINKESYWDSLDIEKFTDRNYLNQQVCNFNSLKENDKYDGMEISKIYDCLTNGVTNPSQLLNDDKSIINNNVIINGFSSNCDNKYFEQ